MGKSFWKFKFSYKRKTFSKLTYSVLITKTLVKIFFDGTLKSIVMQMNLFSFECKSFKNKYETPKCFSELLFHFCLGKNEMGCENFILWRVHFLGYKLSRRFVFSN